MMYVPSSRDGTEMPVPTTVTRALEIGRPEPSSRSTPVIVPVVPWAIASTGTNTATANDTIWRRRIIASFFSFRRWSLAFWSDEMQNGEVRQRAAFRGCIVLARADEGRVVLRAKYYIWKAGAATTASGAGGSLAAARITASSVN